MRTLVAPLVLFGVACSALPATPTAPAEPLAPAVPEPSGTDSIAEMRAAWETLMARPEHDAAQVTVQHLLIAVEGLLPGVTRSAPAAEALTAELWTRLQAGADFDALVRQYTEDSHPGIYAMSLGEPAAADVYPREAMALGFGDVAWRLQVGEYGVMRYDGERFDVEARSPFGFHLVKRLE